MVMHSTLISARPSVFRAAILVAACAFAAADVVGDGGLGVLAEAAPDKPTMIAAAAPSDTTAASKPVAAR